MKKGHQKRRAPQDPKITKKQNAKRAAENEASGYNDLIRDRHKLRRQELFVSYTGNANNFDVCMFFSCMSMAIAALFLTGISLTSYFFLAGAFLSIASCRAGNYAVTYEFHKNDEERDFILTGNEGEFPYVESKWTTVTKAINNVCIALFLMGCIALLANI